MKSLNIPLKILILLLFSNYGKSQDRGFQHKISVQSLIDHNSIDSIRNEHFSLQNFIESIYQNSSKYYNQALPNVKRGEYIVIVIHGDNLDNQFLKTKDLKNISINDIDELSYKKTNLHSALYGKFAENFGVVILKLKK